LFKPALPMFVFVGCLATVGSWSVLRPSTLPATTINQIIVVVDSEPYTLLDLQTYSAARVGRQLRIQDPPDLSDADRIILEQFITEKLIAGEIYRLGIKIDEQDIDLYIEQVKQRNKLTDAQLEDALRRDGMNLQRYRASIRAEIEKKELVRLQVEGKVDITDGDVERYYLANQKGFMVAEKIHLRHILLLVPEGASSETEKAVLAKAQGLRQQILQKGDFPQLARQYSEGAGASAGGDIGWVDRQSLLREIANAAFNLPVGTVSEPVRTSLGIHLFTVEARRPARPIPLEEIKEKIREELYSKAIQERFETWLKTDLRRRHRVDIKLAGFVFRAEETNQSTVDSLMASSKGGAGETEERTFMSYLNPISYIITTSPVEDPSGEPIPDMKQVKFFGIPLLRTESADDPGDDPFAASQQPAP